MKLPRTIRVAAKGSLWMLWLVTTSSALGQSEPASGERKHPRLVRVESTRCEVCHQTIATISPAAHQAGTEKCISCHETTIDESGTNISVPGRKPARKPAGPAPKPSPAALPPDPAPVRALAPTAVPTPAPSKVEKPHAASPAGSWEAARRHLVAGELPQAAAGFQADLVRRKESFVIQFFVACSEETVQKAVAGVQDDQLFILPVRLREKDCYSIGWGVFAQEASGRAALAEVPAYLLESGVKPRLSQVKKVVK